MTNEETYQPVETEIGVLNGRTAITLDDLLFNETLTLTLRGVIEGSHASAATAEQYDYTLRFINVFALKMIELDSWYTQPGDRGVSSFDEVLHSRWQASLGGKVGDCESHFMVMTYDYVIEVICHEFELSITALE